METYRAAVELIRNPVVRQVIMALLGALLALSLWAAQRELGAVHAAVTRQSVALAKVEDKVGDISEKLARVEERYTGHGHRIETNARDIGDLRGRIDRIEQERETFIERWKKSMDRHDNKRLDKALQRILRAIRGARK